jgi:hypothetical protein
MNEFAVWGREYSFSRFLDLNKGRPYIQNLPWVDGNPDDSHDKGSTPDVEVLGQQCGKVHPAYGPARNNIDADLRKEEGKGCEEDRSARAGALVLLNGLEKVVKTPERCQK